MKRQCVFGNGFANGRFSTCNGVLFRNHAAVEFEHRPCRASTLVLVPPSDLPHVEVGVGDAFDLRGGLLCIKVI